MRPTTLLLAALQSAIAAPHFPVFSWDTLPVFLHVSTQSQKVFSPADLRVAVRFPAVTLEKWQGCSSPGRPTQEDATLATAAALKSLSPSIAVFAWYDSMRIYANSSLNPSILDKVNQSCVNNVHTPFLETHREYLLPNASGQPALDPYIHAHVYDHRSEVVRAYWRDSCVNLTLTGLIDGCGADASQQTGSFILGLCAWGFGRRVAVLRSFFWRLRQHALVLCANPSHPIAPTPSPFILQRPTCPPRGQTRTSKRSLQPQLLLAVPAASSLASSGSSWA